jgi:hypothetical protein
VDLSGTIYGTYLNTDGNQTGFRLLDYRRPFRINPQFRRYFDLYGRWHGPGLVMEDTGGWERNFHPDTHDSKERAKVTFTWGSYWDFKKLCDAPRFPKKRASRRFATDAIGSWDGPCGAGFSPRGFVAASSIVPD